MIKWVGNTVNRFKDYIFDSSINIKDRSFILFSTAVLFSLILAVPSGLIMGEPPIATISTAVSLVFFTIYLVFSFKTHRLERAKIVISIILVFIFLPGMFFTNGGVYGGTPVWLLLGTIYISLILEGTIKRTMLVLEAIVLCICWVGGYFFPELVTTYSNYGNYVDTISALFIVSGILYALISFQIGLFNREEENKRQRRLFEQTATALVNAIDAKDPYTHGHSSRVAEYSRKLAEMKGKSKSECTDIYFAALLHDVGKIGIPANIINKPGKLTDEEYEIIKQHTAKGAQILQSISEYPSLSICTLSHHERYDGKGYPHGLKGTEINETARIVAVADAYDAMTSKRSYRDPIPQQKVREELVKGVGTQFDPEYAKLMLHLIDLDTEFEMKERRDIKQLLGQEDLVISEYRSTASEGILLSSNKTYISLKVSSYINDMIPTPSLILFDSLDGRVHSDEASVKDMHYFEYGEIWFDGYIVSSGARKMQMNIAQNDVVMVKGTNEYLIEAVRVKDHVLIKIINKDQTVEITAALPDCSRYAYIGITGKFCRISNVKIEKSDDKVHDDYIPRIAEEISYINVPAGDIPNVQIDGYRTGAADGVEVTDGMQFTFHAMSLPTARLVWHCPFIVLFYSDDGKVTGDNYHEFAMMRFDGECWDTDPESTTKPVVEQDESFTDWDQWKDANKDGYDSIVDFRRSGDTVTISTKNAGVVISATAEIKNNDKKIYAAITGDQCAITDIHIKK